MTAWQVLALDSEPEAWRGIAACLNAHGLRAMATASPADFRRRLERSRVDLAIVDLRIPDEDGFDLLRRLRARWDIPLIAIGAADDEYGCVVALELGADDYLRRPVNPLELLARIRALHRRLVRSGETTVAQYRFLGCIYTPARRELAAPGGAVLRLTAGEDRLLRAFLDAPRRLLSRERLLQRMHGAATEATDRSVDILVSRLRRKLGTVAPARTIIRTERSGGYIFMPDVGIELGVAGDGQGTTWNAPSAAL